MFPLVLEFARATVGARCVVLGNAAQTLHPVAGQGFNVGLRDAFELAQAIVDSPRETIGDPAMLQGYARGRRPDRWAGIAFTHGLVNLFGSDRAFFRWPRGLALTLLDACRPRSAHSRARCCSGCVTGLASRAGARAAVRAQASCTKSGHVP